MSELVLTTQTTPASPEETGPNRHVLDLPQFRASVIQDLLGAIHELENSQSNGEADRGLLLVVLRPLYEGQNREIIELFLKKHRAATLRF